jgi:hypothetical protein
MKITKLYQIVIKQCHSSSRLANNREKEGIVRCKKVGRFVKLVLPPHPSFLETQWAVILAFLALQSEVQHTATQ